MSHHVRVATVDGRTGPVLRIAGELDLATVDGCRDELYEALAGRKINGQVVTLDLTGLRFLSAGGLRMLADFAETLMAQGIAMTLTMPPDGPVRRLTRLVGLEGRMVIVDGAGRTPSVRDAADARVVP